jgi:hypothetical protein
MEMRSNQKLLNSLKMVYLHFHNKAQNLNSLIFWSMRKRNSQSLINKNNQNKSSKINPKEKEKEGLEKIKMINHNNQVKSIWIENMPQSEIKMNIRLLNKIQITTESRN